MLHCKIQFLFTSNTAFLEDPLHLCQSFKKNFKATYVLSLKFAKIK